MQYCDNIYRYLNYLPFWKIQTQFWRCDTAVSFILDMIFISLVRIQSSLLYKLTTQNNNNQNVSFVHLLFSICLNYKTLLFIILEKISRICLSFSISSFFLPFFFNFLKIIYQNWILVQILSWSYIYYWISSK